MTAYHRIRPYIAANRYRIGIGLAALITVDLLQLYIPRVIKRAVDALALYGARPAELLADAFTVGGIALLIGGFRFVWRHCLMGTSRLVEEGLRNELFRHVQTLQAGYFDRARTGDIMANATNDIQQVRMAIGMGMVALNDAVILGAAAIAFMAYIHAELTLYVLVPMPLIIFGTRFFSRKMHRRYKRVQASFGELTETVRERLAGIRVVKAYGRQGDARAAVGARSGDYVRENISLVRVTGIFLPMMVTLTNVSMAIVLYVGGTKTLTLAITPGDLVAFISYLGLLTWPMMAMGWVTNLIQRGKASLERLDAVLSEVPEIRDAPDARPAPASPGVIRLDGVGFTYAGAPAPALTGIDLTLRTGEMLGIVGPPGSGKSTLLALLPRIYDVGAGTIRMDGVDIRDIRLADLRSRISLCPQEPFLFSGTVRENITLNAEVDGDRLMDAVRRARLAETVAGFPRGLDTVVGERGVILSGGQKQRIALARLFVRPAPVLLLDDPVSQVDSATAAGILEGIEALRQTATLVMVSHRIAAVHGADRVVVLDRGRIAEAGPPKVLAAAEGYYARMHRMQTAEEAGEDVAEGLGLF